MDRKLERNNPLLDTPLFTYVPERDRQSSSTGIWQALRGWQPARKSRVVRELLFMLTTLPIGLVAFVIAVTGGVTGAALSWLLIGIPILVWTIGLLLRTADFERERINVLLDERIAYPDYGVSAHENALKHLLRVSRSPQVWRDAAFSLILFPLGILELVLVSIPFEFLLSGFGYIAFGSFWSVDVFGIEITNLLGAFASLGVGMLSVIPVLFAVHVVADWHVKLARRFL